MNILSDKLDSINERLYVVENKTSHVEKTVIPQEAL